MRSTGPDRAWGQEGVASNKAEEDIVASKAEQSQVWLRDKRRRSASCKTTAPTWAPRCTIVLRQWSPVETAPTENTSVHGHDSDLGSSLGEKRRFQCRRLPSYRRTCKKVRLKHGRDRERTSACTAAGHRIDSILSSARPTLVPKGKKKRQSSRVRVLTGHQKRHKVTICDGVHTNTWRVVEGIMAQKQVHRQRQLHRHRKFFIQYVHTTCKGYTHRHKQLHMYSEAITYNMYRQQQKGGHRVHGKTQIWEHWQPTKTPHSTTEHR